MCPARTTPTRSVRRCGFELRSHGDRGDEHDDERGEHQAGGPGPKPRPPSVVGLPNQWASDAPSGRVITYAAQKAAVGPSSPTLEQAAITTMAAAYSTAEVG
jgi:hypothetical protein